MEGIEYVHSFAFNPSKWLMVHFDCTAMWYVYYHYYLVFRGKNKAGWSILFKTKYFSDAEALPDLGKIYTPIK